MMKYKNIIFDFGNVLVKFDEKLVLDNYCTTDEEFCLMRQAVFHDWERLDEGSIGYAEYMEHVAALLPERLHPNLQALAKDWYCHLTPMKETWDLIHELKSRGYSLYILSNAPTYFAEHASFFEITEAFDGIVFSGPLKMLKPWEGIYKHLFTTYGLKPQECLFLDDKKENIRAGEALGMDGIVFTGDVHCVREWLEL